MKEINSGKIAHAYLFIGGKEEDWNTLSNLTKDKVKISNSDIMVLPNTEEEIKVDEVRRLLHWLYLAPVGQKKLAIIKNCQTLNSSSGNVLLKSLEEPPKSVIFLLFSLNDSVLPTIYSRCRVLRLPANYRQEREGDISIFDLNFPQFSKELERLAKDEQQISALILSLENHYAALLEDTKRKEEVDSLWEIQKAKKRIKANVNPRLTLENLFLSLKR